MVNKAKKIIDAIGRDVISQHFGFSAHSIVAALTSKSMPASWYREIKMLCDKAEIDCPMDAFNWKDSIYQKGEMVADLIESLNPSRTPFLADTYKWQ